MLSHRHLLRQCARPKSCGEEKGEGDSSFPSDPLWGVWKKTIGKQFEKPHRPCNWLGGKVPFPLNPSFKPPTPVSNALRNTLYQSFMTNPEANSVRNLAGRYHLSIKRVDAILRLKGLEESWIKGKPLQTGFLKGMEQILGVTYDASKYKTHEHWVESRINTVEADALDQAEGNNKARTRYQRMFWEPVVEGQESVLGPSVSSNIFACPPQSSREESTKFDDVASGLLREDETGIANTSGTASGRLTIKFIDVGNKLMDRKDHMRRMKESQRRARIRSKNASKRHLR
ncbi:eukaryotic mitochondrial regulator protein-domain-containing protein [Russula aff. rugulosa BPL654]|nr:eukaryotic mitochondrial regulator protein-domain-containing protein [Russula aff. rugulosa BPL654]